MKERISVAGTPHGLNLICSGYLVENERVLLVHHRGFDKWVPPGGHLEAGETFAETAAREFQEETGISVIVISAAQVVHDADENASPSPVPFYVDVEREGFSVPALVQFFYVRRALETTDIRPQISEVFDAKFFDAESLEGLQTFEQVRSLARFALSNHPDARQ